MHVPLWLSLLIAGAVIGFGIYRLWLAFAGPSDEVRATERRGLMAMPRRSHGLVGFLYILVGAALLATSFGFNPFKRQSAAPPAAPAPASGTAHPTALPVGP